MHRTVALIRLLGLAILLMAAACGDTATPTSAAPASTAVPGSTAAPAEAGCADVIAVDVERSPDGTYAFAVTVASADTGNEKYADAWELRTPDGAVIGIRILTHPHVGEQPFTRSLGGIVIPEGVIQVEVAARDSVVGYCGVTMTVAIPVAGG